MKFTLPLPPSINRTYGVSRYGDHPMYKKRAVKDWELEAEQQIMIQKRGLRLPTDKNVEIGIKWFYRIDRDIDAGMKILLDLLERASILNNDRQVRKITGVEIYQDIDNPRVEVEINEID